MANQYNTIPDPLPNIDSLREAIMAAKEVIEVLTGQRKSTFADAVTTQDLIDLGILDSDGTTIRDNGGLLKYVNDIKNAGTVAGALQSSNNLSDVASAVTSRSNLGVAIGTNVLAYDAQLTSNIRQNSQSAAYTLLLSDGEKHIYHPSADTTARIWTIPANSSVAFPLGTAVTFVNDIGAGVITLAITTDTLVWFPSGSTGSRSLAAGGLATALKIGTTRWVITGSGLS